MAYNITDFSNTEIFIDNGWKSWYIPKFRIYMTVDGDYCNVYWTDTERGSSGLTRRLQLDYNDVTFNTVGIPSNAGEVKTGIEGYIDSGFGGGSGNAAGGANLWAYKAKTSATSGDPASEYLLWDNATQISATSINVSHLTDDNFDIELFFDFIQTGDTLIIQDRNDSTNFQIWIVSGSVTIVPNSYVTIPLTLDSSGGTGTTNFPNNHQLFVARFSATGSGTGDVVGPASAVNNNIAVFDLTTGKLIKDGGQTIASILTTSTLGSLINGATSATPNDTDLVMSVESSVAKKNTWTQIKAFLKTYFDTVYQVILTAANFGDFIVGLTGKTTPVDADSMVISDSAASDAAKKVSLTNFWTNYLKVKADALYQALLVSGSNIKTVGNVSLLGSGDTGMTEIYKSADQTRNSTTAVANDSELIFTLDANKKYYVEGMIVFDTDATPDFRYTINGPASPNYVGIRCIHTPAATVSLTGSNRTSFGGTGSTVVGTGTGTGYVSFEGIIDNLNAGTFGFGWGQGTSDPANTTVKAGSMIRYKKIN